MEQNVFTKREIDSLKIAIKDYLPKNILLIRGGKSFELCGAKDFIYKLIGEKGYVSFSDFDVNPKIEDVERGVEIFHNNDIKLIIAIGGGSVLDMAKLISVMAHQNHDFAEIIRGEKKLNELSTSLLAIPTTAGTGAEATHFAVVYINMVKYSLAAKSILPNYVFLSSEFSLSANKYLAASTGLDAFAQAIEAAWSINSTTESDGYAFDAIYDIWNNLYNAVNNNDIAAKEKMLQASFLAGKAINITKTTAPHAISYAFTTYYNIPHGHAVALSLPYFMEFNYGLNTQDCNDKRGVDFVKSKIKKILEVANIDSDNIQNVMYDFLLSIGIEININKLISNFDKSQVLSNINIERLGNNPRKVSLANIEKILK